jgi:hypothetical protein
MSQWTQNQYQDQNEALNAICAVYVPDDFVLLVDMGLHNAGWGFARSSALELHEVIGSRAKFCWAGDVGMVEVVNPAANPNHQQLAEWIHADEKDRADGEKLVRLLDDLFKLVGYKLHSELDLLMRSLDISRSAPEYLVGILRATSKDTRHLSNWTSFLSAVKAELSGRGLDAAKILIGLL